MQQLRALVVAASVGLVALSASSARADAVMPPPRDCPDGAVGDTGHNGPWCRPTTCNVDGDCAGVGERFGGGSAPARVCREQGLCVEVRSEKSASGWSHGQPFERTFAHGACGDAAACTAPATCEAVKRCVVAAAPTTGAPTQPPVVGTPPTPAPAPPAAESRCSAGGTTPAGGLWLLALVGLRRRRGCP
ncbi:MAG: hypothetical protein JNL82_27670 [Myxococcales bacterium]|nr:hypothetical protein [Myxococcales bacterium]